MLRHVLAAVALLVSCASSYSLYEPTRLVARPDYALGVVFLEEWRGDVFLGLERIISMSDYLDYQLKQSVADAWLGAAKRERERADLAAEPAGLIPDIELPKLPIFGEGSRIDISGRDRITMGGSQTVVEGGTRLLGNQRLFPELKMEQQLAVSLNGTIGERTSVTIDHDSERQEGQNRVKLSYTGADDDVVQSVELGDTRLAIPSTGYTGDLPAHHGLFGVSAKGKLAGADVYAIASREESQSQTQSFTGQRRVTQDGMLDIDYEQRRFYQLPESLRISRLRVYVDDRNTGNNQSAFKAIATYRPDDPAWVPDSGSWQYDRAGGDFDLKAAGTDFLLREGNILEFTPALSGREVAGVVIYTDSAVIGGGTWNDSLVLKLLKPEVTDSLSLAWDDEMRSVYSLGRTDVKLNSLKIVRTTGAGDSIDYEDDTGSPNYGRKFVEILGLDPNGDGRIEYPLFDSKAGLIRFPDAKPFASTDLSVRDSVIYLVNPDVLPPQSGRLYTLIAEFSSATESYYLGQTDITENSERVTVNGQTWTRGTDYSLDPRTGVLTFLRPLPLNADIKVTFEYRPLYSATQKSLVGVRGEWAFMQGGKLGSSIFFRDEGMPEDHPTLGTEPFRRVIAEADASYGTSSDAVTAFLDRLPAVRAQGTTSFSASAEGAVSMPDPNTRGAAYIDDFEQTANYTSLTQTALLWSPASVPVGKDTENLADSPLRWATPLQKVRLDSVYGAGLGEEGDDTRDVLLVEFRPDPGDTESWAGIMVAPPEARLGLNFRETENLQIVARSRRNRGRLHVSFGMAIDEDAPRRTADGRIAGGNGQLDTEDRNGNGKLDEVTEDNGLDTTAGVDSLFDPLGGDDGNDDYDPSLNQGGTEGNQRLNSEDIDGGGFSRYNHYFEVDIPLNDARFSSELSNGWRRYQIRLQDTSAVRAVGSPKWEDVRVARLWYDGFEQTDTIELFSVEFVGSKWRVPRFELARDTNMVPIDTNERITVLQVSRKTDTTYVPPFEPKRDAFGQVETENALELRYSGLHPNRRAYVSRSAATAEDYRDYRSLRFYFHRDSSDLDVLLRLGGDSGNYYEFVSTMDGGSLVPGRDGRWYEFLVELDSFPGLRSARDSVQQGGSWSRGRYRVFGSPTLAEVRYVALGMVNARTVGRRLNGSVWFDDIRLTGPRKDRGLGAQARAALQLSDLASLGVTFGYSDPNFRSFSEGRGVKTGGFGTTLNGNATVNLHQLLPASWGLNLPLSYSRTQQRTLPKFAAGYSDLRLSREMAASEAASAQSQSIGLDNVRKARSASALMNYTLEAMGFGWRRQDGSSRSVLRSDSASSQTFAWSYSVSPDVKVRLGADDELYLLPRNIRLGLTDVSNHAVASSRARPGDTTHTDTLRGHGLSGDLAVDFSPLEDLSFDYSVDFERDRLVRIQDTFLFLPVGSEAARGENIGASYEIEVADVFTPSIELEGQYEHDRPKLDTAYAPYRNVNNSGELTLAAGLDLPELVRKVATAGGRTRRDTSAAVRKPAGLWTELGGMLDAVDVSYGYSRSSEYPGSTRAAPWQYRLGLTDTFASDSGAGAVGRSRDGQWSLRVSSGFQIKELSLRGSYDLSQGRDAGAIGATSDRSVIWPSLDANLGKVHTLFAAWATDSRLSAAYRRRENVSGELRPDSVGRERLAVFGRQVSRTNEFTPLVSWQTTWKKRVTSTVSLTHSATKSESYLSETGDRRSVASSSSQSASLQMSYTFSAPRGLVIPFLRRVRFSSDLSLNGQLRYSRTLREQVPWDRPRAQDQNDNSVSGSLGASYRFSRSIEAGLNAGYSETRNEIAKTKTKRTDVDLWVQFRF